MEAKSVAKNISVSPRKIRLILDTVRGRPVNEALTILRFLPRPAAADVAKAIKTAAANAENTYHLNPEGLKVVRITADEGIKLRRAMPMARGRAGAVRKRHAHITVVVGEGEK